MKLTVELELLEEVTPSIFSQKLAIGLSRSGTLREGERVTCGGITWQIEADIPFQLSPRHRVISYPHITKVVE